MTDNEIIKALEVCVNKTAVFVSYRDGEGISHKITIKDILNLINRLTEEKKCLAVNQEALLKCLSNKKAIIAELDEEVERLKEIKYAYNSLFK